MRALAVSAGLSDQQARFVSLVADRGFDLDHAAELAGYSAGYGRKLARIPAVAGALHEALALGLQAELAPMAYQVAKTLLGDKEVSPRVRADLSIKILDRAGHIVPSRKGTEAQKALSEMNQAELLAFIERNQAEIDKAEAELAGKAIDVSRHSAPPSAAKPLDYLD